MKRSLEVISVKNPCTVPWESMAGDDETRFCTQCQQSVYNLSAMTRSHAEAIVEKSHVCVRYVRRADGTVITHDCEFGLKAARRRVFRMAAAIASGVVVIAFAALALADLTFNGRRAWLRNAPVVNHLVNVVDPPNELLMGEICPPEPGPVGPAGKQDG